MATYKEVAIEAAKEAGEMLLELSKNKIKYSMKNSYDILAEGDLQSEKIIISKIKSAFPDHNILSEEAGEDDATSEYLWIIDPIDGTINFSRHIEEYCISIALSKNDELILGILYQPEYDNLYVAEKGKGAYLNGQKISVSDETEIINSLCYPGNSTIVEARVETFNIVNKFVDKVRHFRIFGSAALGMAKLAKGQIDFIFNLRFHYWDYAAGILILEEAGGKVTDLEGQPINRHSPNIVASNGHLHEKILKIII